MSHTVRELEQQIRRMTPVSASTDEHQDVVALSRLLGLVGDESRSLCRILGPGGESTPIPETIFYTLERVAELLRKGQAITVVPVAKALTTQQAAEILNVSRQYVVRLLDDGRIPSSRTGKHRRVLLADVLAFKYERTSSRRIALDTLAEITEEIAGYPEFE